MTERAFDIVLWGATGATGRRAANHLARRCGHRGLRLAIGGRNRAKLEALRIGLPDTTPPIEILVGDSHDTAFMADMTARARVVVSTVGPFALYGSELVAACAQNGTQYCDLTGEAHWMRAMIDAYESRAQETGARIVHSCGHDSIPSDLGVQFLQEAAVLRHGKRCKRVTTRITRMTGGFSGGTAASFVNAMKLRETDPNFERVSRDPYALCPERERDGPDGPDRMMPLETTWDPDLQAWTKPYFMAPMNAKVVRRTNAILGYPYGRDFRYAETALTRSGIGGWWAAMRYALFARLLLKAMAFPPTRGWLERRILPKSGEGPSQEVRETGSYEIVFVGETPDGAIVKARLTAEGDPAVRSTTLMLTEAALCLAEDADQITVGGGFWTPASALGALLRNRITEHAGVTLEMLDVETR